MSKKNLLNEGTVRRFMKLAEIEPLTNQFVGKLNESDYMDEEPVEEGMDADYMADTDAMLDEELDSLLSEMGADYQGDDEAEAGMEIEDEEEDMEMDAEAEGDDMEMDAEMDMEEPVDAAPAGGMDPEAMREMVKDAVMDALKQLVDAGDLDISMDEPEEVDVEAEVEDKDKEPADDEDAEEDEMVNEVARRVMKRIINSRR